MITCTRCNQQKEYNGSFPEYCSRAGDYCESCFNLVLDEEIKTAGARGMR